MMNETNGEISPAMADSIRRTGEVNFQITVLGHEVIDGDSQMKRSGF
jgi:hypothetical protein